MTNKIEITSKVENGKLNRNRSLIESAIKCFEGKQVTITIEKKRNKRTSHQNRWYFGVAVQMVVDRLRELGTIISKEDAHVLIKLAVAEMDSDLIYSDIVLDTSEVLKRMRSTTEYTTTEFMAFKDIVQQWASETLDIYIPDPNEQTEINLN